MEIFNIFRIDLNSIQNLHIIFFINFRTFFRVQGCCDLVAIYDCDFFLFVRSGCTLPIQTTNQKYSIIAQNYCIFPTRHCPQMSESFHPSALVYIPLVNFSAIKFCIISCGCQGLRVPVLLVSPTVPPLPTVLSSAGTCKSARLAMLVPSCPSLFGL
jgi:hypothetical protein